MSFCDEAVPVEVGEDGLALSDWDTILSLAGRHAEQMRARASMFPSISARQVAANAEAMRLRVLHAWRRKMGHE